MIIEVKVLREPLSATIQLTMVAETDEDKAKLSALAKEMDHPEIHLRLDRSKGPVVGQGVYSIVLETAPEPDPVE